METILAINPSVDILVNNAGIARFIPFEDSNEDVLDMHINLNIKSMYLITKALYSSLIDTKGCVINISSYFADRMLHNLQQMEEEKQIQFRNMISTIYPLQKIGEPNDIAQTALFLASDMAKWITGTIVHVDGGLMVN